MNKNIVVNVSYSDIPFYRKRWFSVLLFVSFFPVWLIFTFTGDIYYKKIEKVKVKDGENNNKVHWEINRNIGIVSLNTKLLFAILGVLITGLLIFGDVASSKNAGEEIYSEFKIKFEQKFFENGFFAITLDNDIKKYKDDIYDIYMKVSIMDREDTNMQDKSYHFRLAKNDNDKLIYYNSQEEVDSKINKLIYKFGNSLDLFDAEILLNNVLEDYLKEYLLPRIKAKYFKNRNLEILHSHVIHDPIINNKFSMRILTKKGEYYFNIFTDKEKGISWKSDN